MINRKRRLTGLKTRRRERSVLYFNLSRLSLSLSLLCFPFVTILCRICVVDTQKTQIDFIKILLFTILSTINI